jgi:hypothetical protein
MQEAEKIGLRESPHLNEFARKYIEKHRQKSANNGLLDAYNLKKR